MRTTVFMVRPCGPGKWGVFLHDDARALESFVIKRDAIDLAFELAQAGLDSTVEVHNERDQLECCGEIVIKAIGHGD